MAFVDWKMKGPEVANCNCAWGCPCQFNSLPTHGDCRAMTAMRIDKGHYGDVKLDGLKWVMTAAWPGPIHEGKGRTQFVVDEKATSEQRAALEAILHGKDTVEGGTFLWVFHTMSIEHLPTLYKPIQFDCDVDKRVATVIVPGLMETKGEPIRNPMTKAEHRAKLVLAASFEFAEAEFASGDTHAKGDVKLDFTGTHAHFANLQLSTNGVMH
jgi:hypothetical protein